jgi:hypothetical protein
VASQAWFKAHFRVYRLTLSWVYQKALILITLTTPEIRKESGWTLMRQTADSFKLL